MKQNFFKILGLKAVLPVFLLILCSCTDRNQMNFYKACANNDVETCKAILEKHPDIPMNVLQMTSWDPPIQSWLEENKPQYYPSDGSASQKLNNLGNLKTVTRITVICDSVDVLSFLLESGKIDNTDLNDGLSLAVQNGRTKIAELLLKNGANPNGIIEDEVSYGVAYDESYLNYSIKKKNEDIAKILIEYGADVNYEDKLHKENDPFLTSSINGSTTYEEKTKPLHTAAAWGEKEICELLLARGANLNAVTTFGMTPLMYAANSEYTDIMKILLQNGADQNIKDNLGQTVLERAVTFKKNKAVEVLLGLDEYEEWSAARIQLMGLENIGKKVCVRNAKVTMFWVMDLIYLTVDGNSLPSRYEKRDSQLNINLAETVLSLNEKYNANSNSGYADYYGYIENFGQTAILHITHILEK